MISVFLDPIPRLGIAMKRVAMALAATAPPWARIVSGNPAEAQIQLLHPVALDARKHRRAPRYAVMMHCLSAQQEGGDNVPIVVAHGVEPWDAVWRRALVVWSYYDIAARFPWGYVHGVEPDMRRISDGPHLYYAPLGVDGETFRLPPRESRDVGILTTGYVSGPKAEAIEECALAAHRAGVSTVHLGPSQVSGMTATVPGWSAVSGIDDNELAALYGRCRWVSGLRHTEGFELPVLEGLASGARPICFDLPCYRQWFGDHAVYVKECAGDELVDRLAWIMSEPPTPVTHLERDAIIAKFDWRVIGAGFWRSLESACVADSELAPLLAVSAASRSISPISAADNCADVSVGQERRRLLWIGDSPTRPWTGFGKASDRIVQRLLAEYDVTVLGTTSDGDPHDRERYPYDVYRLDYAPYSYAQRVAQVVGMVKPSVVVAQHDPWYLADFARACGDAPVVGIAAIDGLNCRTDYLNGVVKHLIVWTEFAREQAAAGGWHGPTTVVPLGVDLSLYHPMDRVQARRALRLPAALEQAWIVGCVTRNQPRKRLDLTVRHFAEWVTRHGVRDAYLYIQTAPTRESAYDVPKLMEYERLASRLLYVERPMGDAIDERLMHIVYGALDVYFATPQGEGFCIPALEAMACGRVVIAPRHSAFESWAPDAAHLVQCSDTAATINALGPMSQRQIAVIGHVPDRDANVQALDGLYRDPAYYLERQMAGQALAARPEYRWEAIGDAVLSVVNETLVGPVQVVGPTMADANV